MAKRSSGISSAACQLLKQRQSYSRAARIWSGNPKQSVHPCSRARHAQSHANEKRRTAVDTGHVDRAGEIGASGIRVDANGLDFEIAFGAQQVREQSHDLDVRHGTRRRDARGTRAGLGREDGGLERRSSGALVENVGEMHTWVKIRG